jgi:hypothetical protein
MIDPANVPGVATEEVVARYVLFRGHVRADKTVKPDAFIPHPHRDLSVTRHYQATEAELWEVGENVAANRRLTLHGRADVRVEVIRGQSLEVVPDPIPGNPNHANMKEWPAEKSAQKIIAAELAKAAIFLSSPGPKEPVRPIAQPE